MNIKITFVAVVASIALGSCGISQLETRSVAYQSVRPVNYKTEIPNDAKIIVRYGVSENGQLVVSIKNNTDEIMTIDQTKSFLVTPDGMSKSYYDPTLRVTSKTRSSSDTHGSSLNLGAVAAVLGVGGPVGTLASGINVGGANTAGYSTTNTEYLKDMPQISLGPRGSGVLSKTYSVKNLGTDFLSSIAEKNASFTLSDTYCKFSVCISYSLDGGNTFDKIVTDFYANSWIVCSVRNRGKVNDALRNVYKYKSDCLNEPWWLLYFNGNIDYNNVMRNGTIIDYR